MVRGSNPGGAKNFRTHPEEPWGSPQPPRQLVSGVKRQGRDVNHPPPFRGEVKERVEQYLYSPCGPSWPLVGRTSPLDLPLLKFSSNTLNINTKLINTQCCHSGEYQRYDILKCNSEK